MNIFTYKRQILEGDLDTLGHVNNASYLRIFEEARWDFITAGGYGLKEVQTMRISPIILSVEVFYKKEIKNREMVRVESLVKERLGEFRLILEQKVFNEEGKLACLANFTMATMNLDERKMVLPPERFLHSMGL
jgi:acyl-CoA thioester hydrolase